MKNKRKEFISPIINFENFVLQRECPIISDIYFKIKFLTKNLSFNFQVLYSNLHSLELGGAYV